MFMRHVKVWMPLLIVSITLINPIASLEDETVTVDLEDALHEVSDQFLSVTIDAGEIKRNFNDIDFKAPRVLNMAKALSPAMLRVGGTEQDFLIFNSNTKSFKSSLLVSNQTAESNFTLNSSQWDALNMFVEEVGWELIFGLNVFLRTPWPIGSWDSANAKELLTYTTSKGYKVNWELGNEPDHFAPDNLTNATITPEQLAKDVENLQLLVKEVNPMSKYIAGPDVAGITAPYFEKFLSSVKTGVLYAVTWHHYYCNGHTATFDEFLDVKVLDHFIDLCALARKMLLKYQPESQLWLGETSNCYGGGSAQFSPTYLAGFMWLDKLGVAALTAHQRVFRQDFVGGSYALLDSENNPRPDYWLSVLYKKVVGKRVLNVTGATKHGRTIRVYAHCTKFPRDGAVVLIMLNLNQNTSIVRLGNKELVSASREVYWLTPPPGTKQLTSQEVALNGVVLKLVDNTSLPELSGEHQGPSESFTLPATSFGFYVFLNVSAKPCLREA